MLDYRRVRVDARNLMAGSGLCTRTVTVAAATCTEAGVLSSMAMLQGAGAESFLRECDADFNLVH